jgi:hypothetical protein
MMWFDTSRRAWYVGMALLIVTFVAGALSGAAAVRVLSARDVPAATPRGHQDGAADLFERLDLTADQRGQVEEILDRRRERMTELWSEHRPRLRAVVDSARYEIRGILTPAQLQEEERFWAERQAYFAARERARQSGGKQ